MYIYLMIPPRIARESGSHLNLWLPDYNVKEGYCRDERS
jgi:hypothetical protein